MSNKELCISIINDLDEDQLSGVTVILKDIKKMLDDLAENAYCLKLYNEYLTDDSPDKHETITLEDYAKELGITLE